MKVEIEDVISEYTTIFNKILFIVKEGNVYPRSVAKVRAKEVVVLVSDLSSYHEELVYKLKVAPEQDIAGSILAKIKDAIVSSKYGTIDKIRVSMLPDISILHERCLQQLNVFWRRVHIRTK